MKPGDLVRIKEIPGTRFASKREPIWGVIVHVNRERAENELDQPCIVNTLTEVPFENEYRSRKRVGLHRRHFDLPTDKQIPDWVCVELARRALLTENSDG